MYFEPLELLGYDDAEDLLRLGKNDLPVIQGVFATKPAHFTRFCRLLNDARHTRDRIRDTQPHTPALPAHTPQVGRTTQAGPTEPPEAPSTIEVPRHIMAEDLFCAHPKDAQEEDEVGTAEERVLLEHFEKAARAGEMDLVDLEQLTEELAMIPPEEVTNIRTWASQFTESLAQPPTVDEAAIADVEAQADEAAQASSASNELRGSAPSAREEFLPRPWAELKALVSDTQTGASTLRTLQSPHPSRDSNLYSDKFSLCTA